MFTRLLSLFNMSATMATAPHESIEIDVETLETNATRLVCLIKPNWVSKKLIVKKFGTNDNNTYYSIYSSTDEDEHHGVVIKLYPANSDVYMNHQAELKLIDQLAQHGLTLHVLLTFNNGYLSNYVVGKTLDFKEERTQELIAKKLAEFHSIPLKSVNVPPFIDRLKLFIDLFTKKNPALHDRLIKIKEDPANHNSSFFSSLASAVGFNSASTSRLTIDQLGSQLKDTSWAELSTEIDFIRSIFNNNWSKHNLPVVLTLNNINVYNFLYDSKNKQMSLLDFDHCSSTYFLVDLVSYFLELSKQDPENKYPPRHVQKLILAEYLKHSSLDLSNFILDPLKSTDIELERLCDLCGLLIAPVHLYWALWAFSQALLTKSTPTFDYINYGKTRLAQYQKHKQNFFLPLYHSPKKARETSVSYF